MEIKLQNNIFDFFLTKNRILKLPNIIFNFFSVFHRAYRSKDLTSMGMRFWDEFWYGSEDISEVCKYWRVLVGEDCRNTHERLRILKYFPHGKRAWDVKNSQGNSYATSRRLIFRSIWYFGTRRISLVSGTVDSQSDFLTLLGWQK